jgi:DNA (cytosine-5)-methyltransferase 1
MSKEKSVFKFIDLFAGIGGFHLAMHNQGGECVFASEWDKYARQTYEENFKEISPELFIGNKYNWDINDVDPEEIEDFDILCAGFPCQPFSIAGKREGFNDTRGTLFFNIENIISVKRPKVVLLENVKNLVSHDKGRTFNTIITNLEDKLGYKVYSKVLNSATCANIPQNRERIFIIGFDPNQVENHADFKFPENKPLKRTIHSIIDHKRQSSDLYYKENHKYYPELAKTIVSRDTIYQWRRVYVRENKSFVCPTLTANMGTGGHNVPLVLDDYGIRKLSPKECLAFQGFPENFKLPKNMANSHCYKQAGNSVVVAVIEEIAKQIVKIIKQ